MVIIKVGYEEGVDGVLFTKALGDNFAHTFDTAKGGATIIDDVNISASVSFRIKGSLSNRVKKSLNHIVHLLYTYMCYSYHKHNHFICNKMGKDLV